jgi:hypothetical protein
LASFTGFAAGLLKTSPQTTPEDLTTLLEKGFTFYSDLHNVASRMGHTGINSVDNQVRNFIEYSQSQKDVFTNILNKELLARRDMSDVFVEWWATRFFGTTAEAFFIQLGDLCGCVVLVALASLCLDVLLRIAQFIAIYFEAKRISAKNEEEKDHANCRPGKKESQEDSPKTLFYVLLCILAFFSEF